MSYQSPFQRVQCTPEGIAKIKKIQQAYDELYRSLHKTVHLHNCQELSFAFRALQESGFWYSRACAIQHDTDHEFVVKRSNSPSSST